MYPNYLDSSEFHQGLICHVLFQSYIPYPEFPLTYLRANISIKIKQNTVRKNRNILSIGMSLVVFANDFFVSFKSQWTGEKEACLFLIDSWIFKLSIAFLRLQSGIPIFFFFFFSFSLFIVMNVFYDSLPLFLFQFYSYLKFYKIVLFTIWFKGTREFHHESEWIA